MAVINYHLCNLKVRNGCAEIDQKGLKKKGKKKSNTHMRSRNPKIYCLTCIHFSINF